MLLKKSESSESNETSILVISHLVKYVCKQKNFL